MANHNKRKQHNTNEPMSWELKTNTRNRRQARENARD